jgi:hypothetical protein
MDRGGPSEPEQDHDVVEEALQLMLRIAAAAAEAREHPPPRSRRAD